MQHNSLSLCFTELQSHRCLNYAKGFIYENLPPNAWTQKHSDLGGFPGGTVVKNPPANAGDTDSSPGPGRSPCTTITEPVCHNYWACALEPVLHNRRRHRNEKPAHRNEDPMQPKINKVNKLKKKQNSDLDMFSISTLDFFLSVCTGVKIANDLLIIVGYSSRCPIVLLLGCELGCHCFLGVSEMSMTQSF